MDTPRQMAGASAAIVPLDPPPDGVLGRLYALWREQCAGGALPPFKAIRPEELRFMLGRINLIDVLAEPLRFRYRLVGTVIAQVGAIDMQGQLVSALKPPVYARMIEEHLVAVHANGQPALYDITVSRGPVVQRYRRIVLPYAPDPSCGAVGTLMTGTWHDGDLENVLGHPDFLNG